MHRSSRVLEGVNLPTHRVDGEQRLQERVKVARRALVEKTDEALRLAAALVPASVAPSGLVADGADGELLGCLLSVG